VNPDAIVGSIAEDFREHMEVARAMETLLPALAETARCLEQAYTAGGRVFTFGNGGSAADSQHLAAELVGHYRRDRRPLAATALTVDPSVVTCISNDYGYAEVFSRQVRALAGPGDVVAAFTTSGRSVNVVRGLATARSVGAHTLLFSAGDGMPAAEHADLKLLVPSASTARVQEMHLLMLHVLSEHIDRWAVDTGGSEGHRS
jgi:D-sedoheptulose 7-phosphate isomerase